MRNKLLGKSFAVLAWLVAATGVAVAQGGCEDSPENPTVVLGLLGAASAGIPWIRARWLSRRHDASKSKDQGA
jgi:XrtJ-associated TM-motif-TM protein